EQRRAEEANRLLAEVGGLLSGSGSLEQRLRALVEASAPVLADLAAVRLLGPDGLLRPVATACPADPQALDAVLRLPPAPVPPSLAEGFRAGRAFVLPGTGEEVLREISADDAELRVRLAPGMRDRLLVPLTTQGRLLGLLTFVSLGRGRTHDVADLVLAEELGRRAAAVIFAEQAARRERQLQEIMANLAAAESLAEVAQALTSGIGEVFDTAGQSLYVRDADRGDLRVVHVEGYRPEVMAEFATIRPDDRVPHAAAARTGEPVWLRGGDDWRNYPGVPEPADGDLRAGAFALPLKVTGQVVAVLGASFRTPRQWLPDERELASAVAAAGAQAVQRAVDSDRRRSVAEILQRSLLPAAPPALDHLALAPRYLPAVHGVAAGGDWYDVIALDAHHTAIVVGDVVGQGAPAAAVMGQLRSALAAALLHGDGPAAALANLSLFAVRVVPDARASTAVCLVVDGRSGELTWATAGHPPPLLLDVDGVRFLDGAGAGPLLGVVPAAAAYREGRLTVEPGTTVLLYTDGLVERRGEVIDDGLARVAAAAATLAGAPPQRLIDRVLAAALDQGHNHDDVAVLAARLLPAALHRRVPARAEGLAGIRRGVQTWAAAGALDEDQVYDLQLALGEALANAVEHAYRDGPPDDCEYTLTRREDGTVDAVVRDFGTWQPPAQDRGYRGRGLELVRSLGRDVTVESAGPGTTVRFRMGPAPARVEQQAASSPNGSGETPIGEQAGLDATTGNGSRCIRLTGDVDLAAVDALREQLLGHLDGAPPTGDVVLDLRGVTYLGSAGVGLVLHLAEHAAARRLRLELRYHEGDVAARVLRLCGLDRHPAVVPPARGEERADRYLAQRDDRALYVHPVEVRSRYPDSRG
ncbi:MAG: SpoIIE family protein phosphatase, partial [Pseudonocardia sp.]|nr:SpoIIE family protein phosphatase [Pseudonocardia sp.]